MKTIRKLFFLWALLFATLLARPDEGMWLLSLLKNNIAEMEAMGCKLSESDIYSVNTSSLKDAIVGLGRKDKPFSHFCSAEVISPSGLILTNHHCAFSLLQKHSSNENNILKNGFWASTREDELSNPGITASNLVSMEEVTDIVLQDVSEDMSETKRSKLISKRISEIEEEEIKNTYYRAKVKSMFKGNRYFLFVHVIYKDVRIVGAPPAHLGKFGGDTDNWEWPRHTADFALLRIYTSPEGKPAEYSEENIPLKSKHFLPVSLKGYEENDFAMILGFPGSTDRFLTSWGVDRKMNIINKNRYHIRTKKLNVIKTQMNKSEELRIKYATKYARSANYWKHAKKQNEALKRLKIKELKENQEQLFSRWIASKPEYQQKYGKVLEKIKAYYAQNKKGDYLYYYLREALDRGPDLFGFAGRAKSLEESLKDKDAKEIEESKKSLSKSAKSFFKNFDKETEIKLQSVLLEDFYTNVPDGSHPPFFAKKIRQNDFKKFAEKLVEKSLFADRKKFNDFLAHPTLKKLRKDPAFKVSSEITAAMKTAKKKDKTISKYFRLFTEGILEMNKDKNYAPDANSTLRLSYSKVAGYQPKDAVQYNHYTTIDGIIEKKDNSTREFFVDEKLQQLYAEKSYGKYTNHKGELPTCFITDADITGGNSGSPVLNKNGELIGIAFDSNSEAMSNDIHFDKKLKRCISVDIRYVLWIVEHYAGALHIIDELKLVE